MSFLGPRSADERDARHKQAKADAASRRDRAVAKHEAEIRKARTEHAAEIAKLDEAHKRENREAQIRAAGDAFSDLAPRTDRYVQSPARGLALEIARALVVAVDNAKRTANDPRIGHVALIVAVAESIARLSDSPESVRAAILASAVGRAGDFAQWCLDPAQKLTEAGRRGDPIAADASLSALESGISRTLAFHVPHEDRDVERWKALCTGGEVALKPLDDAHAAAEAAEKARIAKGNASRFYARFEGLATYTDADGHLRWTRNDELVAPGEEPPRRPSRSELAAKRRAEAAKETADVAEALGLDEVDEDTDELDDAASAAQ